MTGLRVERVSFAYGPREALAEVSFSVPPGRFCALLGPNGAGKSTLVALLTGLFAPKAGRIAVAGADLAADPRRALARTGIVFQQPTLDPDLTVRRNLDWFAALHGLSPRAAAPAIEAALARLGLSDRAAEKARTLSGGLRRRVEIARALVHGPSVLILDEPGAGLDPPARRALVGHVHALAEAGLAVLWTTHIADEICPGDRFVLLDRGRVAAEGEAGEPEGDRALSGFLAPAAPA